MAVKNYGIHDKWTDINKVNNVEIQSVDGVIENILVNGEPAGGGGDLSTAQVTFNVIGNATATLEDFYQITVLPGGNKTLVHLNELRIDSSYAGFTFTIPMVNGKSDINIYSGNTITVSGNAEYFPDDEYIEVTGDCTITIS